MTDTELVAALREHIEDDLSEAIKLVGEAMSVKMFNAIVEFVLEFKSSDK